LVFQKIGRTFAELSN